MQPILVIVDNEAPNRFSSYLTEILDIEGICCRDEVDLAHMALTPEHVMDRKLVIVANIPLDKANQDILRNYVIGGGCLIALRPPPEMADLFGVHPAWPRISEGFITLNSDNPLTHLIPVSSLQFHGEGDLYKPGGAIILAWFSGTLGAATHYPAIFWKKHGAGAAAAFAYDLAASTVLFHQGCRQQSSLGIHPDADRDLAYKPNDLFVRYLDERLKTIPQADIHQDLLVAIIQRFLASASPLPRLWHFPQAAPAVAFISGDSDGMKASDLEKTIQIVESAGGKYTLNLMANDFKELPPEQMAALQARGHDFCPHFHHGRLPTPDFVRANMKKEMAGFLDRYHYQPLVQRGHSAIWVGWTEHAKFLRENGIRMDTNFFAGVGFQEGYLNGSGQPAKFMDEDGHLVDVYEQAFISSDDCWLFDKCLLPAKAYEEAIQCSIRQIDETIDTFHTVYQPCFHPVVVGHIPKGWTYSTAQWLEAVCRHVRKRSIPFVSGREWVLFNDARRAVRIESAWDKIKSRLELEVSVPEHGSGLTILLPRDWQDQQTGPDRVTGHIHAQIVTLKKQSWLAIVLDGKAATEKIEVRYQKGQQRKK